MLRLALIFGTAVLLALQPLDAEAQNKNKNKNKDKLKHCLNSHEGGVPSHDRCVKMKGVNPPTELQIGGSSFGPSGNPVQGGATGSPLMKPPTLPAPLQNKAPIGPPIGGRKP